jgi:hypothetical protein
VALDQQLAAAWAIRVFPLADKTRQIARIDEVQAFRFPNLSGSQQGL